MNLPDSLPPSKFTFTEHKHSQYNYRPCPMHVPGVTVEHLPEARSAPGEGMRRLLLNIPAASVEEPRTDLSLGEIPGHGYMPLT